MTESLWGVVIGGLIGFSGGGISTWISHLLQYRRENEFRKHDSLLRFKERQFNELYAPMLSLRMQIRGLSESRSEFANARDKWWGEEILPEIRSRTLEQRQVDTAAIQQSIEYDNNQLKQVLLPKYRKMVEIFMNNYALAETEMQKYYYDFIHFVDVWDRSMSPDFPREPLTHIKHKEEKLYPLYNHLEYKAKELAQVLSAADTP